METRVHQTVYSMTSGNISLIEVLVLKEARLNDTTGACGK